VSLAGVGDSTFFRSSPTQNYAVRDRFFNLTFKPYITGSIAGRYFIYLVFDIPYSSGVILAVNDKPAWRFSHQPMPSQTGTGCKPLPLRYDFPSVEYISQHAEDNLKQIYLIVPHHIGLSCYLRTSPNGQYSRKFLHSQWTAIHTFGAYKSRY